jgi:Tfp pilus assembly ATPase PilU
MRSLYDWDRYNLKFIPASTDCTVDYIVGTPGIAKSTTMLMIKYFNEMRISYILSNECPSNSQFKINYKIFYFQANYT